MAIANAVHRGSYVHIYDAQGNEIRSFGVPSTGTPPDGLVSFTASTVNVRLGGYILIFDENGLQTGSMPV